MTKQELERLAILGNVSISTVSKSVHHCPGVDNATRMRILKLAEGEGLYPGPIHTYPIYITLPDNPKYYWSELQRGLLDACGPQVNKLCRVDIYTRIADAAGILCRYLQQVPPNTGLVVAAVSSHDPVLEQVKRLTAQMPVFLLTEYIEAPGAIFFGADTYTDAQRLGTYFGRVHPERKNILCLTQLDARTHQQRVQGFYDALPGLPRRVLALPQEEPLAAHIARLLHSAWQSAPFDAVYCTDGVLPFVCRSVLKAGLGDKVVCVGYENPKTNQPFFESGLLAAALQQDGYAQGELAMRAALRYLEDGTLPPALQTVPSRLYGQGGRLLLDNL